MSTTRSAPQPAPSRLGHRLEAIAEGLGEASPVPGRLERIANEPFDVLVDFAHTPDALDQVAGTLKALVEGRLIVVFGAGGDRDPTKRPEMGAAVARHADIAVVTSDNPRTEDPAAIVAQVARGVSGCDSIEIVRPGGGNPLGAEPGAAGRRGAARGERARGLPDRRGREAPLRRAPHRAGTPRGREGQDDARHLPLDGRPGPPGARPADRQPHRRARPSPRLRGRLHRHPHAAARRCLRGTPGRALRRTRLHRAGGRVRLRGGRRRPRSRRVPGPRLPSPRHPEGTRRPRPPPAPPGGRPGRGHHRLVGQDDRQGFRPRGAGRARTGRTARRPTSTTASAPR